MRGMADGWKVDKPELATIWEWRAYAGPRIAMGRALTKAEAEQAAQAALVALRDINRRDSATQAWLFTPSSMTRTYRSGNDA